jgi:hypothetical protein
LQLLVDASRSGTTVYPSLGSGGPETHDNRAES